MYVFFLSLKYNNGLLKIENINQIWKVFFPKSGVLRLESKLGETAVGIG